jgi:hypothetical protein
VSNLPEDPADFDLIAFFNTGTIGRTTVVTYNDHEAWKRMVEIDARLEELGVSDEGDSPAFPKDEPLSAINEDQAEVDALLAEVAELEGRRDASKMTWHVRAISDEETKEARRQHKAPVPPTDPGANASPQQREKFNAKVLQYSQAREDWLETVKLEQIAVGVEHVETSHGQHDVTVATLRALKKRPHGQQWLDRLYQAISDALQEDVDPPRPTSPGRFINARG